MNPDWQVITLDKNSVSSWLPKDVQKIISHQPLTLQAKADLIRLHLLKNHGGVWADATLLPILPLNEFLVSPDGKTVTGGFFYTHL
mgnify:CR=1 FL=1